MNPGSIKKIAVYAEKVMKDLLEKYPTLTGIAVTTTTMTGSRVISHYVISGTDTTISTAKTWLGQKGHDHDDK